MREKRGTETMSHRLRIDETANNVPEHIHRLWQNHHNISTHDEHELEKVVATASFTPPIVLSGGPVALYFDACIKQYQTGLGISEGVLTVAQKYEAGLQ